MTTALGVDVDTNGNGVDPLTHRQIIKRHWGNTGIVGGLTVSGRSDLYYAVSAGVAVCSMGAADGYTEAYFAGGNTENAVSAGDATYPRIDTVYILANTGSPDNLVHVEVAQGTPSASPVKPALPVGAQPLMSMLLAAGAQNTGAAIPVDASATYAIPYGASMGVLNRYVYTGAAPRNQTTLTTIGAKKIILPTDRNMHFWAKFSLSTSGSSGSEGGLWGYFRVDGQAVTRWQAAYSNQRWDNLEFTWDEPVEQGTHTVDLQYARTSTSPEFAFNSTGAMKPIVFTVTDMGVIE